MNGRLVSDRPLVKLLDIARQKTEQAGAHIADLETARASAQSSIDWLRQALGAEETAATGRSILDMKRFLEGSTEKRRALEATRDMLDAQIAVARRDLAAARAEQKKFEHLLDRAASAETRRQSKIDQEDSDAAARVRRAF